MLKVGEAECKSSTGTMDLFLGTKLPEKLPIGGAAASSQDPEYLAFLERKQVV